MKYLNAIALLATTALATACVWDLALRAADPYRMDQIPDFRTPGPAILAGHSLNPSNSGGLQPIAFPAVTWTGQTQEAKDQGSAPGISSIAPTQKPKEVKPPGPVPGRTKPRRAVTNLKKKSPAKQSEHRRGLPKIGQWVAVELSVYSKSYHGSKTATGQRYNHYGVSAATTTRRGQRFVLPPNSVWQVEYRGRTVTVRINDNGPTEPTKGPKWWLDLSGKAWREVTGGAPGSRIVGKMRLISKPLVVSVSARRAK